MHPCGRVPSRSGPIADEAIGVAHRQLADWRSCRRFERPVHRRDVVELTSALQAALGDRGDVPVIGAAATADHGHASVDVEDALIFLGKLVGVATV